MDEQEYRELIHCMRLSQRVRNLQINGMRDDLIAASLRVTSANVKAICNCAFSGWTIKQISRLEILEDAVFDEPQATEAIPEPDKKEE